MELAIAGGTAMGATTTNHLLRMQHHKENILTSASFTPPPRKSWLDKLVDMLRQEGRP